MKKWLFLFFTSVPVCFLAVTIFCGCGSAYKKIAAKHVAEMTRNMFFATDSVFNVFFRTGERESEFASDGVVGGKLVSFGVLTVQKKGSLISDNSEVSFRLDIDGHGHNGTFEVDPFDKTRVFDVGAKCGFDAKIGATILYEGKSRSYTLKNVFEKTDSAAGEVLKIACKTLKKPIAKLTKLGKLAGEVHVRIVFSPSDLRAKPLWYVSIIDAQQNTYSAVVHPATREVLAKKL